MPRRARGEGSVRKIIDKEGKIVWEASITLPPMGDGIQRKRRAQRRTQALALDALREMQQEQQGVVTGRLSVEQWLREWLEREERSGKKSPGTIANYRWAVEHHLIPSLGRLQLRRLEAKHVSILLGQMRESGSAKSSMKHVRQYLGKALDEAVAWRKIPHNVAKLVTVPEPLEEPDEAAALRPEQARRLLQIIDKDRLRAAWLVMIHRGLRPGEVCGLRWSDVDLQTGVLHVEQQRLHSPDGSITFGPPKRNQRRSLALDAQLVAALVQHRDEQAKERERFVALGEPWPYDLVFTTFVGTPIDRSRFRRAMIAVCKRGGLDGDWHPTDLRRSFASLAALAGRSEAEIGADLGHRPGSKVTLASYVRDLREVRGNEAGEAISKLLRQKS
jgi:integrase